MKYSKFEQHIKDELYMDSVTVDTEQLIQSIHHPRNKSKRPYLWLLLGLFLFVTVGAYGWNSKKSNRIDVNSSSKKLKTNSNQSDNLYINNSSITEELEVNNKNNTIESTFAKIKTSEISNKNVSALNPVSLELRKPKLNNSQSIGQFDQQKSIINLHKNKKSSFQAKIPKVLFTTTTNNNAFNNSSNLLPPINQLKQRNTILAVLPHKLPSITLPVVDPVKCFDFGFTVWTFDMMAEVGILSPLKTLTYLGPTKNEVYNLRREKEKSLEGIQAAIYLKVSKESTPFYIKIGGSYTRIAEQMELNYTTSRIDTTQGIISITESENGDTLTVIRGDIYTETTTNYRTKNHHYFHLFDIPIGIGYTYNFSQFSLGAELGVQMNLFTKTTGKWLENVGEFKAINAKENFRPNVGISYYASLDISRKLSYRHGIYLSARFRYLPNNFGTDINTISQKYSLAGLHLGYQYSF